MAKSRIVASSCLASLAFAAIALGFNANESPMAASERPLSGDVAVAEHASLRRSEASVTPAEYVRRAHVAGSSAPLGAADGTELQRAQLSRGEPGSLASSGRRGRETE